MEAGLKAGSPAAWRSLIHVYENAPHTFHTDYRPSYRKAEAEDA
jgi:carboxymethylenebutenolidase